MDAPGFAPARVASLRLDLERRRGREHCVRRRGRSEARRAGQAHVRVDRSTDRAHRRAFRSPRPSCDRAPTASCSCADPRCASAISIRADNEEAFTDDGWFRTGDLATFDDGADRDRRPHQGRHHPRRREHQHRRGRGRARGPPGGPARGRSRLSRPLMGERVAAFVVTDATFDLDAARAWFAERGVAKFKTPERMLVVARAAAARDGQARSRCATPCGRPRVRCRRPSS